MPETIYRLEVWNGTKDLKIEREWEYLWPNDCKNWWTIWDIDLRNHRETRLEVFFQGVERMLEEEQDGDMFPSGQRMPGSWEE